MPNGSLYNIPFLRSILNLSIICENVLYYVYGQNGFQESENDWVPAPLKQPLEINSKRWITAEIIDCSFLVFFWFPFVLSPDVLLGSLNIAWSHVKVKSKSKLATQSTRVYWSLKQLSKWTTIISNNQNEWWLNDIHAFTSKTINPKK